MITVFSAGVVPRNSQGLQRLTLLRHSCLLRVTAARNLKLIHYFLRFFLLLLNKLLLWLKRGLVSCQGPLTSIFPSRPFLKTLKNLARSVRGKQDSALWLVLLSSLIWTAMRLREQTTIRSRLQGNPCGLFKAGTSLTSRFSNRRALVLPANAIFFYFYFLLQRPVEPYDPPPARHSG